MRRSISLALSFIATLAATPATPVVRAQAVQASSSTASSPARAAASKLVVSAKTIRDAERITADRLRKDLTYISSDQMAGRDTPSPGLDMTADFIARRLRELGVKPAGDDGTYLQKFPLYGNRVDATKTRARLEEPKPDAAAGVTVGGTTKEPARDFRFGEDFVTTLVAGSARGRLVYVGHGWVVKSKNIDAYKGIDVRDKIIVVSNIGAPEGVNRNELSTADHGTDWLDPAAYAARNGARGIVLLPRTSIERERYFRQRRAATERGYYTLGDAAEPLPSLPTLIPSDSMLARLLTGEQVKVGDIMPAAGTKTVPAAFDFAADKILDFTVSAARERVMTQNVVGVLEGSDTTLKNEYVALGAHYDHVGTGTPDATGDKIYNGADDDGSGTVGVLAIAEAFARASQRPKRSILFVWHAGEEKGLWGSQYFANHPTVPLNQIVTQLNIDMIGRSRAAADTKPANKDLSLADEIYVIGSRMMSTTLGDTSESVNGGYLNLKFNYKYDDPKDTNRFFFRSDHFNYAAKGIPIIFYFSGVHEDYHRPSDTVDKIDFTKMERVTRTIFATAARLAEMPQRPAVDRKLPAELTER